MRNERPIHRVKENSNVYMYVNEPEADPVLGRRMIRKILSTIFLVAAATIGGIVILILMGALKLLGVKEL